MSTSCDPMNYSLPVSTVHGISQQGYWNGLPFPSPGDLPDPGMEPTSPALEDRFFTTESPGKPWCSTVAEYKANIKQSIMFLNNRNKQMETEKKIK